MNLNRMSQRSAELILPNLSFVNPKWETQGRVDVVAFRDGREYRIEIKLVTPLNENKSRLKNILTNMALTAKALDFLLVTTVAKKFEIQQGFKSTKMYCIIRILVSKVEIETKDSEQLAEEILENASQELADDEEFQAMLQETVLQLYNTIEEQAMETLAYRQSQAAKMMKLETKVDSLENKVENKVDSLENKVENKVNSLENKVDKVEKKIENVENEVKDIRNDLGNLHGKVDDVLSILKEFAEKKNRE